MLVPWQRWALAGVQAWTPDKAPGIFEWYVAVDDAAVLVPCAQPTVPGAGWSGANWSGSGLGPYTHTVGDTADLAQALLIVGNRYTGTFGVADRTAGQVTQYAGTAAGTARTANGSFSDSLTCAGNTNHIWTPDATFDGKVTLSSLANDSRSKWYAADGVHYVANATAAQQPWQSTTGGKAAVYFDAGDVFVSSRAAADWKFLHFCAGGAFDAPVFTATFVINVPVLPALGAIFSTSELGSEVEMSRLYVTAAGALVANVRAAGTDIHPACVSANGVIVAGTTHVVTMTADGTDLMVRVDGLQVKTVAFNAPSVNAGPDATLRVGAHSNTLLPLTGHMLGAGFSNQYLVGADLAKWEAYWSAI